MALKEVRECDVFPQSRDVAACEITVEREGDAEVRAWGVDLSQRAFDRLVTFIERGCTPPKPKK